MSIEGSGSINNLPDEKLLEIFSHLPVYSLGTICSVSSNWNALAITDDLWKKFFNELSASKPEGISLKDYVLSKRPTDLFILLKGPYDHSWNEKDNLAKTKDVASEYLKQIQIFSPVKELNLSTSDGQYFNINTQKKLDEVFERLISGNSKHLTQIKKLINKRFEENNDKSTQVIFIDNGDNALRFLQRLDEQLEQYPDNNIDNNDNSAALAFLQALDAEYNINDENQRVYEY